MSKKEISGNNLDYNKVCLTFKQKEVLGHLAEGLQNKQIDISLELKKSN